MANALIIPYQQLSKIALKGVVEEFITRDGTDYGEIECDFDTKASQVMNQLVSGRAVIIYDEKTESCNILDTNHPAVKKLQNQP